MINVEQVRRALDKVNDPELGKSIIELGMVHDIQIADGVVSFTFALTTMGCPLKAQMQQDARAALMTLDGVRDVQIQLREMTAEEKESAFGRPQEKKGAASDYNHLKHIVAVVSGKGGVGKSTTAALLAISLRRKGYTVGLLDADITGPSIPKMLLTSNARPVGGPNGIVPVKTRSGIDVISINLLLENPEQAVIWRGPLISGAIKQFYSDVAWGDLDYLVVDLPPGTSDASLTVMQSMPLNGIVLVTTPQSLAGMVVLKASSMASQLEIPVLGIIENMSYVKCPDCGHRIDLFGQSNSAQLEVAMGAPLLGQLPIEPEIATLADAGLLENYAAEEFVPIVDRLIEVMPETQHSPIL